MTEKENTPPADEPKATAPDESAATTPADAGDASDAEAAAPASPPKKTPKPRKPKAGDKTTIEPKPTGAPPDGHWWWGTGRRKTAVARVRIRPGDGKFQVNKKAHDTYFTEDRDRADLLNVLDKTNTTGSLDVHVNVHGGGYMGQAGAIVLGLARALRRYDERLEPILRSNAFLSRDPRKVERKKYGQRGARRKFQFSKR